MIRFQHGARWVLSWVWLAAFPVANLGAQDVHIGVGAPAGNAATNFTVLTSGPLHEAFARPVVFPGVEAVYVPAAPPALIEEVVPLARPAGYSEWITGYWSYDDVGRSWTWVSGTWRVPPAGYTWMPGYWLNTPRGWRYVHGYWAATSSLDGEIDYLPAPPAALDVTPIGTAPSAESVWVPGNWVWSGTSYGWRDGYWMAGRENWIWTPASYAWTPYGYTYTDGFWDYGLPSRGLLYAPVSFADTSLLTSGYRYSPAYVVNTGLFSDSLFVRPLASQYYFGDYYAPNFWSAGYYPAFAYHLTNYGYDPIFAYSSWMSGRNNPGWLAERRTRFVRLRDTPEARPPRTIEEQAQRPVARPGATEGETAPVVVAAKEVATANVTPLKVEVAPESARQEITTRSQSMLQARAERIKLETQSGVASDQLKQARKAKFSREMTPAATEAAKVNAAAVPPKPELPKVEAGAKPEPKAAVALPAPSLESPANHLGQRARREDSEPEQTGKPDPARRPDVTPPAGQPDNKPEQPRRPEGVPPAGQPAPKPERRVGRRVCRRPISRTTSPSRRAARRVCRRLRSRPLSRNRRVGRKVCRRLDSPTTSPSRRAGPRVSRRLSGQARAEAGRQAAPKPTASRRRSPRAIRSRSRLRSLRATRDLRRSPRAIPNRHRSRRGIRSRHRSRKAIRSRRRSLRAIRPGSPIRSRVPMAAASLMKNRAEIRRQKLPPRNRPK